MSAGIGLLVARSSSEVAAGSTLHVGGQQSSEPQHRVRAEAVRGSGWARAEWLLAVLGAVLIPGRFNVWHLVTVGDLFALATVPLWFATLQRYVGARLLLGLGVLTVVSGAALTVIAAASHEVRRGTFVDASSLMVGVVASIGFLLWAREKLPPAALVTLFGIGLLLGISGATGLYSSNPWRFGFSVPVTILVLGLASAVKRRGVDLIVVLALAVVSALTDARSSFAILLLTAILLAWQMRPLSSNRPASAVRAVLGMATVAAVVYNVVLALILSGFLGVQTQQRSLRQIDAAGSLLLGGRPEITATLALIRDRIIGFGSGTLPNFHDVAVVKEAMSNINYDPNNGYVENQMLGSGFALHSIFGDLWAQSGFVGLIFVAVVFVMVLQHVGHSVSAKLATGIMIYLSMKTLWNIFFAPWYSSIPVLTLLLALMLVRKPDEDRESVLPDDLAIENHRADE